MSYEGTFRVYVFPTIIGNMGYVPPIDMQLGCHTLMQANIQFEKMLKEYPNRRIWLIQGYNDNETMEYIEKIIVIA